MFPLSLTASTLTAITARDEDDDEDDEDVDDSDEDMCVTLMTTSVQVDKICRPK